MLMIPKNLLPTKLDNPLRHPTVSLLLARYDGGPLEYRQEQIHYSLQHLINVNPLAPHKDELQFLARA